MEQDRLVVGRIPFLVALGFFHLDLDNQRFRYLDGTPAELNRALQQGLVDLAPASSFEYLRHPHRYKLLPDYCTSGVKAVRSALLFSNRPWSDLQQSAISMTPDSESAAALLKILLRRDSLTPSFVENSCGEQDCDAELLIGNQALLVAQQKKWPYSYDLCTLWYQWHSLPFAFGAWMVRKEKIGHPELICWRKHLARSVESFRANPNAALERWKQHNKLPNNNLELDSYWQTLEYRMGSEHHRSLELFAKLAFEAGLLEQLPTIEYLDPLL